ncbi:cell adhesion molecule Dscam2-like isoform X4 [Oratosquilla oratoria]
MISTTTPPGGLRPSWLASWPPLSIFLVVLSSITERCHGQVGGIGGVPTGPVLLEFPPPLVTFTNSTGVVVGCRASGDPPPRVTWLHLDHTAVTSIPTVREVLSNGSLRILPFGGSEYRQDVHAGVYQCRATNPTGTVLAAPTTLRAVVVQNVEVQVYDEYVNRGNTAVLQCSIPSFVRDLVSVTAWVRNDGFHIYPSHVGGDGKYAAVDEGRLLLVRAIEPGDSYNTYKCRVLHTLTGLSITSKTARIIVRDPRERSAPRMVTKISNLKIRDDDAPLIIPCVAHSHPPPSYKWWMEANGKRTPLDPAAMSSRGVGGSGGGSGGVGNSGGSGGTGTGGLQDKGVLVIQPFHSHVRQARTIICEAINPVGRASMEVHISRTMNLGVQVNPKVEVVDSGATGVLRCQVTSSVSSSSGAGGPGGVSGLHHSTSHLSHGHSTSVTSSAVSLSWYKDGHPLTPTGRVEILENGGLLQIRGVAKEDTGMYQCFARSDHSTVQDAAEMRLGASAPEFIYKFISQILTHGPTVSLKCIATGTPTPTIKWALDGFPLPHNDRLVVGQYVNVHGEVVSHVNITGVRVEDGGTYSCTATNSASSVVHKAPLYVYGLPYIRPMGSITAVEGEDLRVQCPVAGYPIHTITWARGNRPLPLNRRQQVYPKGELLIQQVSREADAGDYTCTAVNKQGQQATQPLTIKVMVPPKIRPFEFGRLVEGMRTQVSCIVQMGDPPIRLHWLKDGASLLPSPLLQIRSSDAFTSSIVLSKVEQNHAGNYTCVASNPARQEAFTATLRVSVPPRWITEPGDVSVLRDQDAVLSCPATGYPPPFINWTRTHTGSDHSVYHDPNIAGSSFRNGTLLLPKVTEEMEGSYLCEATNGVGPGLSAIIGLEVHTPAMVEGKDEVVVRRGATASLQCEARGDAPLTLSFSRDGVQLDSNDYRYNIKILEEKGSMTTGEVRIVGVTPQDSATYTCTASNAYGSDSHPILLKVQDVAGPPRDLRVTREGSRSVTVAWATPSSPHTPITHYTIQLKPHTAGTWKGEETNIRVKGDASAAVLSDLLPAKLYQIRVIAVNSVGPSRPSEALTIQTEGEPPEAAPVSLRAVGVSPRAVKLSWGAPRAETWHGDLLGYYVGYRMDGAGSSSSGSNIGGGSGSSSSSSGSSPSSGGNSGGSVNPNSVSGSSSSRNFVGSSSKNFNFSTVGVSGTGEESWTVDGLRRFTRYTFIVQAYNDKGPGPLSSEVSASTLEDVPEAPPQDVSCVALTSTRVEISWNPPPPHLTHGLVTTYTLHYSPLDDHTGLPPSESRVVTGLSTTLGDLARHTNYSISVAASTRAGTGVPSQPLVCTTEEDVPQVPGGIKVVVSSSTSVIVAWAAPQRTHGRLVKYTLYMRDAAARDPTTRRVLSPQTTFYEVKDLSATRRYEFWVTASTTVGEGPATRTISAAPSHTVGGGVFTVGGWVRRARGADVLLPCPHVGSPAPTLTWRRDDVILPTGDRFEPQPRGGLLIRESRRSDSGNYTCHVTNQHGSDHISYSLVIMVPPSAILLHSVGATATSVTIAWRQGENGGAPIRKYTLTWRRDQGEWHPVTLARHLSQYTLEGLTCGTMYHLYITPHNRIGAGSASEVVSIRTKGSRPSAPPQHRLVSANTSALTLRLQEWGDTVCPVSHFTVQLRPQHAKQWQIVSGQVGGDQGDYVVNALTPGTTYHVKVTAHNPAGETDAAYTFTTLTAAGGTVPPDELLRKDVRTHGPLTEGMLRDPAFIVPVIISCIALVSIVVAVTLCVKKKPQPSEVGGSQDSLGQAPVTVSAENKSNLAAREQYYATVRKPPPSPIHDLDRVPEYAEDIYPYATFQIQPSEDALSTQFQTFVYQDPRRSTVETLAYRKVGQIPEDPYQSKMMETCSTWLQTQAR